MGRPPVKTPVHHQIYNHIDYRAFLKDLVAELKRTRENFTMRGFSESAGFGSPSYLKMVIDGSRNLTEESLERFCQALSITGREKEYFIALVRYTQSENPDEKKIFFDGLSKLRPRKSLTEIEKSQIEFFTRDYYSTIREMVLLEDFQEDAKWIAARCQPRISPQEARDALETLLRLNLLARDGCGKLFQPQEVVGTQSQTEIVEAFNFHEALLEKARVALSTVKQENRHFEALTIPMNAKLAQILSAKITRLIEESLEEANACGEKFDEVYQLSVQFFPATTRETGLLKKRATDGVGAKGKKK